MKNGGGVACGWKIAKVQNGQASVFQKGFIPKSHGKISLIG